MTDLMLLLIAVGVPLGMLAIHAMRAIRASRHRRDVARRLGRGSSRGARRMPLRDEQVVQGEYDLEWLRAIRHVSRDQVEVGRR